MNLNIMFKKVEDEHCMLTVPKFKNSYFQTKSINVQNTQFIKFVNLCLNELMDFSIWFKIGLSL